MSQFIQYGTISAFVLTLAWAWILMRRVSRGAAKRAHELSGQLVDALHEIETIRPIAELVPQLTTQLERTSLERDEFERRFVEVRKSVSGILREKETAWKLYDEQAVAHGNAQVMMMGAIAHLERELHSRGVTTALPSIIRETHSMYLEEHVAPVLERTGTKSVQRENLVPSKSQEPG